MQGTARDSAQSNHADQTTLTRKARDLVGTTSIKGEVYFSVCRPHISADMLCTNPHHMSMLAGLKNQQWRGCLRLGKPKSLVQMKVWTDVASTSPRET